MKYDGKINTNGECERIWKTAVLFEDYISICMETDRKITRYLSQDMWYLGSSDHHTTTVSFYL